MTIEKELMEISWRLKYTVDKIEKIEIVLDKLTKHLIPEKQDTKELSEKAAHELSYGDEPRHYKKCRKCGKKPCVCDLPEKGEQ